MNIKRLFKKEEKAPRCSAVIVAAGSAHRMGSDKINAALGGIPVLVRTLRAFQESELVDEIIVVTRMDNIQHTAELCKKIRDREGQPRCLRRQYPGRVGAGRCVGGPPGHKAHSHT